MYGGIIVEGCEGCSKIEKHYGRLWCSVYQWPERIQAKGGCFFNKKHVEKPKQKVRIGQQKQKKLKK